MHSSSLLLIIIVSIQAQELTTRKIRACIELVGYRIDQEEDTIENIMDSTLLDTQITMRKIVCDLLLHCFNLLTDKEVNDVLDNPTQLRQDLVDKLSYDADQFRTGFLKEISPSEYELLDEMFLEVDNIKSRGNKHSLISTRILVNLTVLFILASCGISYLVYRSLNSYPFKKPRAVKANRV
jgi:hypothetical protein